MADLRQATHAAMRALVQRVGSFDAVTETLAARWGHGVSKGTISRKMSADFDWTLADAIALEDCLGEFPVTRMLARRMGAEVTPATDLSRQGGVIARETGEAVCAILAASASARVEDEAQAIAEIDEAIAALRAARARLERAA
ncbi:hypothetical protein P6F26_16695 [Roseibacterium sp. SDUM158017]|uniref:hypothetical protein n=1 Tax=Roseicyclus salinarum TaxID=3036773 RepID=UPI00241516D0|nr:hypothetical protein [Roseibacterium sp. SDUM158017]MDG4650088.1 hypothetical protein [Roseibacterium sp. SDUM158017]